ALYAIRQPEDAPPFWEALAALENGDGAPLLAYADEAWAKDEALGQYLALLLNDFGCPSGFTLDDAKEAYANAVVDASRLGKAVMTDAAYCAHWPVHAPSLTIGKTSATPSLIIGGREDWVAPVAGVDDLAALLDNGSYTLKHDQPGHVAFAHNACVR